MTQGFWNCAQLKWLLMCVLCQTGGLSSTLCMIKLCLGSLPGSKYVSHMYCWYWYCAIQWQIQEVLVGELYYDGWTVLWWQLLLREMSFSSSWKTTIKERETEGEVRKVLRTPSLTCHLHVSLLWLATQDASSDSIIHFKYRCNQQQLSLRF